MTCNEIENRLPAYLEHLLSPEEKANIECHLISCPSCSRACEDLMKTEGIVRNLAEVEPPPFFEQRIMSRVREEAAQKQGMLRRLFYPLYIKVPIHAFATLLVAVMAFSIYRTVMPELKDMAPPAVTVPKPSKDQTTPESRQAATAPAAITPVKRSPVGKLAEKKQQPLPAPPIEDGMKADRMTGPPSPQREERASATISVAPDRAIRKRESLTLRTQASERAPDKAVARDAGPSFEAALPQYTRKGKSASVGTQPPPSQATDGDAQRAALHLTIHVKDVHAAIGEIERRLVQVNGRIMETQSRDASTFLKAEMMSQHLTTFLDRIKAIGRVNVETSPRDLSSGTVAVNIRITGER